MSQYRPFNPTVGACDQSSRFRYARVCGWDAGTRDQSSRFRYARVCVDGMQVHVISRAGSAMHACVDGMQIHVPAGRVRAEDADDIQRDPRRSGGVHHAQPRGVHAPRPRRLDPRLFARLPTRHLHVRYIQTYIHCVSKKTRHQTLAHNFPKC